MLYRQARTAAPRHFDAIHLSGLVAYQQGRIADALDLLGRAHRLDPRHVVAEMRYALALIAARQPAEAEKHLRHAVAAKPDFHEAWDNLAFCLKTQNRLAEAIACHQKAVAIQPKYAAGWYNLGLTLSLTGRIFEALTCHERAMAADPSYTTARFGRAQALQQAHRIPEAVEEYGRFLQAEPQHHEARSYRLFALHYLDSVTPEQLRDEHRAYGRAVGRPVASTFGNIPDRHRKLRVAILSPDLRTHSCAYFIEPLVRHLDRAQFELYLYHDHFREDAVSERLKTYAAVWRNFVGQPATAVEKAIRADAPDLIVDLAGHTGLNRLPVFARGVAPVQITYLGYPNTTGVAAMDYRFTDAVTDPVGEADEWATERLVRFAPTAWSYAPPPEAPEVRPTPALARGQVTFGCFNNLAKLTDATFALWGRVLASVPGSRLTLKGKGLGDPPVRARYEERLTRAGVPLDRVNFLERTEDAAGHLALYHDIDIALDTFPYHGTTTTCEALWMGVPVLTLAGTEHRSRVGVSLLSAIDQPGWIARSEDELVRIAVEMAANPAGLDLIRRSLRGRMQASPLLDHAGQAARFGAALRECWSTWCDRANCKAA